jgi:D-amino-acid dehydrogenase
MMNSKTCLVIGAGVTGLATAEVLRREGWRVTLVDRLRPGDTGQTSFGNAGLLARSSMVPISVPGLPKKALGMLLDPNVPLFLRWRYLPRLMPWLVPFMRNATLERAVATARVLAGLTSDAVDQHMSLTEGTAAHQFIQRGDFVNLYPQRSDFDADKLGHTLRAEAGFVPDLLDRADLLARDPQLGPRYCFGARFGDYGWLRSPQKYMAALFDHYRQAGGQFQHGDVVDIRAGERPVVTLRTGDRLTADKVVLAAGAWSTKLAKTAGVRINMDTERGYHVAFHGAQTQTPHPYMITDAKFVITPMQGFLRAAGIVEFGGVDAPPSKAPVALIRRQIKLVYPEFQFDHTTEWMGRRPTTPDSLPVVGEATGAPNIIHAYGGQHIGLTIAPRIARMVADMASGRTGNMDVQPFSANRF